MARDEWLAGAGTHHVEAAMAKEDAGRRESDIREDPLVTALVPDPAQLPVNAAVLRGFVGKSLTEGSWRLYLDAGLKEYVEIPESEILYTRELPGGEGTAVWVSGALTLDRVRVAATQIQAEFLSGSITAAGLRATVQAEGLRPAIIRLYPTYFRDECFHSELPWQCRGISLHPGACNSPVGPACPYSHAFNECG